MLTVKREHQLIYEPYTVKVVFRWQPTSSGFQEILSCSEGIPEGTRISRSLSAGFLSEKFHEEDIDVLYQHAFNSHNSDAILYKVQPELMR